MTRPSRARPARDPIPTNQRVTPSEEYRVTQHALARYRERVHGGSSSKLKERIVRGLQGRAPYPPDRAIAIADREERFVAIVAPARELGDPPAVVTIWRWGTNPHLLRSKDQGRKYRYVDIDEHGENATPATPPDQTAIAGAGWIGVPHDVPGHPGLRRFKPGRVAGPTRRRLEEKTRAAQDLLAQWMHLTNKPFVAYSGGKDSTVLAHLARSVNPTIPLVYAEDEDGTFPDVQAIVNWQRQQGPLIEWKWDSWLRLFAQHGFDSPIPHQRFSQQFDQFSQEGGWDGQACGYRAQESRARSLHAVTHGPLWYQETLKRWRCDPLLDWSANEIWAYIALHDLPYASLYDIEDGNPRNRRRVGSPYGDTGGAHGRIARLKRYHPDWYARLVTAAPEVAALT